MKALAIVSVILLLWVSVRFLLYRRQIQEICRQMRFLMESGSRKDICLLAPYKDIQELAKLIDEWRKQHNMREVSLRAKDRQLKEALVNVSHDIRTPLTALKGYFALSLTEHDLQKKEEYQGIMRERMDMLSALLEELFMYTRLQDAGYTLELTKQDMTPFVISTLISFYEECRKQKIEMDIQAEETPVMVYCNEGAVQRIVSNIMRNALQHGNGKIEIIYKTEGQQALFVCRNSLDEETKKTMDASLVFERFYKADEARSKSSTGLGLAISKELVERMNGTVSAACEDGMFAIRVSISLTS